MIRRLLTFSLLAAAGLAPLPSPAAEPINFAVATEHDTISEGPPQDRPFFTVGKRRISFRQPQRCQFSSSPAAITIFLSENGVSGQITISNSGLPASPDLAADIATLHEAAEATLPKEAENTEFKGAKHQAYQPHEWKSLAFEWTYTHFAHPTFRQVAYINLDADHQIRLTIVADSASEAAVTGFAKRFLSSWFWLDEAMAAQKG